MDESEDYLSSECWTKVDINSAVKVKPKKRSLVERELETNLTARITSPVTFGDGTSTSRYGRARRLKTETDSSDSRKITLEVLKSTPPEKSPSKLQSPVYKMHASNSPIRTISPKRVPDEMFLENQIETIYQENISLSRFSTDEITKSSPCKSKKIYIRKDLIQNREPEEEVVLIKSIFSPVKDSDKSTNTHLNNILERSSEKFRLITKDNTQNGFIGNSSVVKTLDFDNKKKKKENKDTKCISKSDLFELEARCLYQVGDLAWSRMGTYPFWPCIVTRDPTTGIYVKKKLFGRIERDVIHVTFFGDNGRRGWIVDSMLRKFKGLAEFESTRDKFTAEDKKKDPKLYAAYFISDKKQPLWNISVEEAETLLREPKRLRIELLNDILENSKSYKTNNKTHKSGKVTRTDSDVSLSESLYDTLFSEDDGKTDDSERSKNKSRNKSLDVSEVVTACLDNMAAKTGITKIQRQSHMDRWLQKAKSKTPEKSHIKAQIPKIVVDNKVFNNKKKKPHREPKPYNLRKSLNESHNLLAYHNEHDYSKFVSDDDSSSVKTNISDGFIENKYEFVPLEESGSGIGVITKIESLADHKDQSNIFRTINNDDFIVTSNKDAKEVCENADISLTEKETQNVESHQSQKFILVQDKDAGINYDNSDDQQVSECTILKENKNPPCDVNSSEIDSTLKVTENSEISNENPMEIDSTDVCKIISSNTILENNNLSVNENISIVNSEMTTDNGNHDISKNNLNSHAEKSNVIPVNHVNFKKEEVNDSVVASVRIEQETAATKGDNIILDLKLLQKNKCDDVNMNNEDCFLFQTESAFIHSIKSTYEDNLEDKNSIYNLAKEINISDTKILSKTNFINNGNIGNSKKFNENKIIHLNFLCNNSHTEETVDHIKSSQEFYDNLTSQKEDTEGKGSIVQEMHDNRNLELNKSSSINLDNCQNSYPSNNELVDADHTPNVLIMDTKIQIISKELRKELRIEDSIKDIIVEDKIKKHPQKSYNINSLHGTIMRKNEIVDSKETFISNLIESDVEITGEEDNLKGTVYKEKNGIYPEELFNINKSQETETRKNSIVDSIEKMDVNLSVSDIETTLKEKSLNDTVNEEIIEKHPENYLNISILQETETRKNGIVDSIETLDVNLSVSDIETFKGNSRKDHLDEEIIEKNPEDFRSISKIQETETRKNAIMGSNETLDVNLTESEMETTSIESSLKDTADKEKIETNPKVSYNINRLQETERRNKIVDPNETLDVNLTKSEIKISLKEDNLYNLQDKVSIKNIDKDAVESLTNVFQECETNKFVGNDNDVENTHMNSNVSGILSNKEKSRINECNNPEFLKYLELRQDAVMDEYPELNEDAIVTYLYQTWLYEESRKSDIKKANNLEQANSVKGLDHITHKKRSRRLKASHIETKKQKSTAERNDKNSASESVTSPVVFFKKNLSLKRVKKMITLSVGGLSNVPETKKDNTTVYSTDKNKINKKNNYNKEIEIATSFKCDSIIPNIDKKESEIICNSVASIDKDPQLLSLHSGPIAMVSTTFTDNCCEKINNIKENVCDETASIDSEVSDVPLIYRKLRIKTREDLSNKNENSKVFSKEEIKSNESFNSVDSESSITKCNEKSKQDMKMMNTSHEDPDASKEESVINNDSFNSTDSETSSTESKQNGKQDRESINTLDVNLEANIVDYETNNDTINVITSEECLVKSKQKSKHNVKTLNLSLETNADDSNSNISSVNVFNADTTLTRPKVKSKFHRNTVNPLDDVEFQKYLELRRDTLLDENPQLTQEEIINYLYKTWLYEENSKSDLKKTDVIAQSGLVKGLEQEIVPPKRIKKKVKIPKEITDYFDVSPKEKPKRKTIKPLYNEDYYDLEDDIECFEINKNDDCGSPIAINVEQTQQGNDKSIDDNRDAYHLQEEVIDSAEIYFSELIKPKPNIFKGLLREKVCEICEKTGNLVKCKTCHGMFHVNCVLDDKVVEISTPMRGRKKKRKGRKAKNQEESEVHSDDKQDISEENNISMEEIEMESLTVDAVTLETQLHEKMKELIESSEAINYDSYTSDNELDWNDTIAGKCEIVDVKLKRKSCEGYVDYTDYKCNNCLKYDTPVCFVCKSDISKKESKVRQRCNVAHCNKYYHLECLDHWPQTQFNAGEPSKYNKKINEYFESVSCPRHVCHTCVSDDPRGCKTRFSGDKLARCVRCPATYHSFTKCIPAGSQILTASHIICPRHYQHRPGKVPCHVNTGWCFICALGGSLICCEYCPTSFHAECLNIDPPEGGYMCEDCETGRLPLYGEMVWVKLGHYRWWPGLILHPSEIPNNIMAVKHSRGEFVVRFFGQYDYYWVNRGRVFPFQEGDTGRISSQRSKIDAAFTTAIEHAHRACEVLKSAIPNEEESMDIASSLLPPHYVKLKVNKPCGSLCGRKLDDPELSLTQCDCNPDVEDPCGPYSQCLNRMLLTECGPSCRAGDRCNNRAFEKRLYPKLVPYRTPQRGWGLKTLEDIKAGQFVIEYVGELIDEGEFKRRMRRKHEIRDENFYFLTLDKERMIDAGPKGNLARFMNHCCEPNCETQKWTVLGDVRVGLFALYDIPANSEVTFNYNLESAGIEKKRCMCGAKRCSGYIGAKPKQDEPQSKKGKVKRTYKKRNLEESPSSATVKTKPKRLGRPPKPKDLTDIERDLLIIRNATGALSSDESSRSFSSDGERLSRPLKRKRVDFSTEDAVALDPPESPNTKRQKFNEKEVGD